MEQQTHFKLQVFGSMKPDVFAGFVDCLGVVGGFDLFPFLTIEEMLRQSDQSFLDFYDITWDALQEHVLVFLVRNDLSFVVLGHGVYDIISFSAASGKLAGASYTRGELVSEQFGKGQKKQAAAPKPRLVA